MSKHPKYHVPNGFVFIIGVLEEWPVPKYLDSSRSLTLTTPIWYVEVMVYGQGILDFGHLYQFCKTCFIIWVGFMEFMARRSTPQSLHVSVPNPWLSDFIGLMFHAWAVALSCLYFEKPLPCVYKGIVGKYVPFIVHSTSLICKKLALSKYCLLFLLPSFVNTKASNR